MNEFTMRPIATIHTVYTESFGIPRQSNLVKAPATITFEKEYATPDAVRGLTSFSHIWLLWVFSEHVTAAWHATVRPPRLGGNTRLGVFATRSPFRPNPIGLSCVELLSVDADAEAGPTLHVRGADLLDGTPILDIKPYIPYADCHPNADGGFTELNRDYLLRVEADPALLESLPEDLRPILLDVLAQDPRPQYQNDPTRIYGMSFAGRNVRFRVDGDTLTLLDIQ